MHKRLICLFLVIISSFSFASVVLAKPVTSTCTINHSMANVDENCDAIFGDPNKEDSVAYFLKQIFSIIKFIGPILAMVLVTFDFVKAVASSDKDALIKAGKNAAKRIVFALLLFIIPSLIDGLFGMFGFYGTCGIG